MASNYWIKFWIEVVDDPKMGRLPDNLWRRFFECCALAGELQQDGRLPPIHDIAWRLRVEEETLRGEFDQLARIGLVDFVNKPLDDHWIVTKFAERQSPMTASDRAKLFRERLKKDEYYNPPDEDERKANDSFTDTDTDTDTEEDTDTDNQIPINNYSKLLNFFSTTAKLPLIANIKPRDNKAVNSWVENEIIEADIKSAIEYSTENNLPIIGPASITNGVMIAKSKRLRSNGNHSKKEPKQYARWNE